MVKQLQAPSSPTEQVLLSFNNKKKKKGKKKKKKALKNEQDKKGDWVKKKRNRWQFQEKQRLILKEWELLSMPSMLPVVFVFRTEHKMRREITKKRQKSKWKKKCIP